MIITAIIKKVTRQWLLDIPVKSRDYIVAAEKITRRIGDTELHGEI